MVATAIYTQIAIELLADAPDLPTAIATSITKASDYFADKQAEQPVFDSFQSLLAAPTSLDTTATDPLSLLVRVLHALSTWPDYHDAVLHALALGGATDTAAALTGGLAGLAYGYTSLPHRWCLTLAEYAQIVDLCRQAEKSGFFPKYD